MKDEAKTKAQLIHELVTMRRRVTELEALEIERKRVEEALQASETRAIKAEAQLIDAIESLTEAFVLYDAEDRLVICNSKYREFYSVTDPAVPAPVSRFEEIVRYGLARGIIHDAVGREEEWLRERMARYQNPQGSYIQQLSNGRWLKVSERRTKEGGIVGVRTDITERKRVEAELQRRTTELEALRQVGLELIAELDLDTLLHTIVGQAMKLLGGTTGSIYLYRPERDVLELVVTAGTPRSTVGTTLRRGEGLSGKVWATGQPLIVEDYQHWEGRATIFDQYAFATVVCVPVYCGQEFLGALNVANRPEPVTAADIELLSMFAAQAAIAIRNAQLVGWLRENERQIRASLREKEILLQEIHHRVKNNLQVISSLLDLQSEHIQDPQALKAFKDSQSRIKSMGLIHEHLYQSKNLAQIDFGEYMRHLVHDLLRSYGDRIAAITTQVNTTGPEGASSVWLDVQIAVPCGLIINELISNALKHAFPGDRAGRICLDLYAENNELVLRVSDDGVGLPEKVDFHHAESMGLQLVNMLTHQLKGRIELERMGGATFKLYFARSQY